MGTRRRCQGNVGGRCAMGMWSVHQWGGAHSISIGPSENGSVAVVCSKDKRGPNKCCNPPSAVNIGWIHRHAIGFSIKMYMLVGTTMQGDRAEKPKSHPRKLLHMLKYSRWCMLKFV